MSEVKPVHRYKAQTLYQENAVWFWQHDGEDFLQSLSCPIIIQPHHLRELLEGKANPEITALQSTIAQLQARIGELESGTVGETPQESRTAWIAVVLQKCPEASISVAGHAAEARAPNGIAIGHWTPEVWSIK